MKKESVSEQFALHLKTIDFSKDSALVVGYGEMGKEYVNALRKLGVGLIRVCSRSKGPLKELEGVSRLSIFSDGYQHFEENPKPDELVILATPVKDLIPSALHFKALGFKKFLIEKPIALSSRELEKFCKTFLENEVEVACAFNRAAYPSVMEAKQWVEQEGGITSCFYTFTEFTNRIDPKKYTTEENRRWGIANSLHVMSLAHALIGWPKIWKGYQAGSAVAWHKAGSAFVGAGLSERGIPFSYHADWGSSGRWSVEVHTKVASYLFAPMEKLMRRTSFKEPWQEIELGTFAPEVKVGFVEQVATMLKKDLRKNIDLVSLPQALALTKFGEEVFGYEK